MKIMTERKKWLLRYFFKKIEEDFIVFIYVFEI